MTEWIKYTGSDEQIYELKKAKRYSLRLRSGTQILSKPNREHDVTDYCGGKEITHYWIVPDDPLREMKILQAQTGQPVWWRSIEGGGTGVCHEFMPPFAHPDKFEYRFTPFEEEV